MTNPITPPSPARLTEDGRCPHQPPCPGALEPDRLAARLVARYPDQGWSLLCNGVVLLDDGDQAGTATRSRLGPKSLGPARPASGPQRY